MGHDFFDELKGGHNFLMSSKGGHNFFDELKGGWGRQFLFFHFQIKAVFCHVFS